MVLCNHLYPPWNLWSWKHSEQHPDKRKGNEPGTLDTRHRPLIRSGKTWGVFGTDCRFHWYDKNAEGILTELTSAKGIMLQLGKHYSVAIISLLIYWKLHERIWCLTRASPVKRKMSEPTTCWGNVPMKSISPLRISMHTGRLGQACSCKRRWLWNFLTVLSNEDMWFWYFPASEDRKQYHQQPEPQPCAPKGDFFLSSL